MNHNIGTVIIAPMTTKSHDYPTRIPVNFESKNGWIVLDQIRTVDKTRLVKKLGIIKKEQIQQVKKIIKEMFVD
jgi:mRNA interferase MazF